MITGFAQKGEDLEPIKITNRSSWLLNFGTPTNEAEEYFYNAGMEVLNQGGFLYAAKIPYSNDMAGIYCAAKYKIDKVRELYRLDENSGLFYKDEPNKDGDIDLIDTPGILWPKFDDINIAFNLASMTIIKEEVLPIDEVAIFILKSLFIIIGSEHS